MGIPGNQRAIRSSSRASGAAQPRAATRGRRRSPNFEARWRGLKIRTGCLPWKSIASESRSFKRGKRADRMAIYEQQNASLREEIRAHPREWRDSLEGRQESVT